MRKRQIVFTMTGACGIPGGIATTNLNVIHALVDLTEERGSQLTILSFNENDKDRPPFLPARVSYRAFRGNKMALTASLATAALKRRLFIFDHVTLALPLLSLATSGLAKTVIFAHGSESWRRIRRMSRYSFRSAALCLTNSNFTLRKMRERVATFNGVSCQLGLSPEVGLNESIPDASANSIEMVAADGKSYELGRRVLLLVGRMHPREREKGHYPLIRILPELLKQNPDVQLVFAGPGEDRDNLRATAVSSRVAHAVFLPGFLPVEELNRLYRHCYAYVMPSLQEGFGLAYLEAMNCGKPCVGCFDQGAEDIIVNNETGFLIRDPNDPIELREVLLTLLDAPDLVRRLGENGFKRLHSGFTSDQYQQRIREQIVRVL